MGIRSPWTALTLLSSEQVHPIDFENKNKRLPSQWTFSDMQGTNKV